MVPAGAHTTELRVPIGRGSRAQLWSRAVERGGAGFVAAALADLVELDRAARVADDPEFRSLSCSTAASLYRQAGRHDRALVLDGRALGMVGLAAGPIRPWGRAATVDALVGLAADNLGLGRFATAARLLGRARPLLVSDLLGPGSHPAGDERGDWVTDGRGHLRWEWVSAELALYRSDPIMAAEHVERALVAAGSDAVTERHRVKTELIAGAVAASAGRVEEAAGRAAGVADRADRTGLLPLRWAALALLTGVTDSAASALELAAARSDLRARGMPFAAALG
ncbi:hypothetical protein [Gordonia soli]|uniref:Uncharacterized protein n=1 Tax=Gordonia soli NBRC 108243 TaxID=1223545 RepID=M0QMN0_9ACTN|nr:hypothetical protein [Gordonia soli]GAC69890.1 hypothetical protein GS4_28_01380 [Gordonia soli NBRC 108243]